MTNSSRPLLEKFPSFKPDHLISTGNFDELYRVRDLENDVWLLARFYLNPIDDAALQAVDAEIEKLKQAQHNSIIPIVKRATNERNLAVFWEYRDGVKLDERLKRELGPRKIANLILSIVDAVIDGVEKNIRMEYLSFGDVLVDIEDSPLVTAGTFSHLLDGKGDSTHSVSNYDQRVINRMGAMLLSICFGRENTELIEAIKLETDITETMFRFNELLSIDPGLMAITAKSLIHDLSNSYKKLDELRNDLTQYLKGRSVDLEGIDFHQLIQSWNLRKSES